MSSSESTSTSSKSYARSKLQCSCDAATCIRVSWTEANLGRRFICCKGNCGWIGWADPLACSRCERVIPGLLTSLNQKDEVAKCKDYEIRRMKIVLVVSWLIFVIYF